MILINVFTRKKKKFSKKYGKVFVKFWRKKEGQSNKRKTKKERLNEWNKGKRGTMQSTKKGRKEKGKNKRKNEIKKGERETLK